MLKARKGTVMAEDFSFVPFKMEDTAAKRKGAKKPVAKRPKSVKARYGK